MMLIQTVESNFFSSSSTLNNKGFVNHKAALSSLLGNKGLLGKGLYPNFLWSNIFIPANYNRVRK
jgi:hypothetical protein